MRCGYEGSHRRPFGQQQGLTLLEVLIALSIFAVIGIASFQVLNTVIDVQKNGNAHSQQLAQFQKALMIIDTDLQQLVRRDIRHNTDKKQAYLLLDADSDYALQLTRAGRANPLRLARSTLLRVAYDVGLHPQVNEINSEFYGDKRKYLRRHYWQALDRNSDNTPTVQALLADID